ncbi:ZPR1 zinc finger domain-containing protein [Nanoarchaeota archaeon]
MPDEEVQELGGQECPVCRKKTLTLREQKKEIPYFGDVFLFSMSCSDCKYHKADVEATEQKDPVKYTFDIESEEDLNVRVIKSSQAVIKIPHIATIESGPGSNGYVTNIEGVLKRIKHIIETARDSEEDATVKKKSKNLLKKLGRILFGQEKVKMTLEDPSGNSAIISDKAEKKKL